MSKTIVERLYEDFSNMLAFLEEKGEVSWANVTNENFRKVLLIAAASHFEQSMTDIVLNFVKQATAEKHPLKFQRDSSEFKKRRRNIEIALTKTFGDELRHIQDFDGELKNIGFDGDANRALEEK